MKSLKLFPLLIALCIVLLPLCLAGQTNCDAGAGPLKPGQPTGISVQDIIQRLSVQESLFKEAQTHYIFTMNVEIQTLQGKEVDGEFRRVSEISFNQGKKVESVSFAPQSTLRRISMSKQDFDDMDNRSPFVLTTQDLPQYDVMYLGQQKVDQLDTYMFDVAPKRIEKDRRYFQGKIWVENHDLAIVKSCGRNVPDEVVKPRKKGPRPEENV